MEKHYYRVEFGSWTPDLNDSQIGHEITDELAKAKQLAKDSINLGMAYWAKIYIVVTTQFDVFLIEKELRNFSKRSVDGQESIIEY